MSVKHFFTGVCLALAMVAGAGWWLQRQSAAQLRGELALVRDGQRELARLRAETQRLTAALPTAAELERLRTDHVAIGRLRGELEKTKDNLQTRERALAVDKK